MNLHEKQEVIQFKILQIFLVTQPALKLLEGHFLSNLSGFPRRLKISRTFHSYNSDQKAITYFTFVFSCLILKTRPYFQVLKEEIERNLEKTLVFNRGLSFGIFCIQYYPIAQNSITNDSY